MYKIVCVLVKGKTHFFEVLCIFSFYKNKNKKSWVRLQKTFENQIFGPILGQQSKFLRPSAKLKINILR